MILPFKRIMAKASNALLFGWITVFAAQAQSDYAILWSTSEGGGTSTGSGYALSGTIGQPDAGEMTGGNYTLNGGFWSLTPIVAGPRLSITRSPAAITVSWPRSATGFVLDEAPRLQAPIPWAQVPFPYVTNATDISISVASPAGNRFYRLRKD